jgi:hypothetical protein
MGESVEGDLSFQKVPDSLLQASPVRTVHGTGHFFAASICLPYLVKKRPPIIRIGGAQLEDIGLGFFSFNIVQMGMFFYRGIP